MRKTLLKLEEVVEEEEEEEEEKVVMEMIDCECICRKWALILMAEKL